MVRYPAEVSAKAEASPTRSSALSCRTQTGGNLPFDAPLPTVCD
jgi:hypothetical protein